MGDKISHNFILSFIIFFSDVLTSIKKSKLCIKRL